MEGHDRKSPNTQRKALNISMRDEDPIILSIVLIPQLQLKLSVSVSKVDKPIKFSGELTP